MRTYFLNRNAAGVYYEADRTDAENAVWNCVAKQPPEEKPLTEMVLGLMRRLSRLSWHRARETSAETRNNLAILLPLLSRTADKTNTNVVVQLIL